jgi:competence protein ComEC
MQLVLVSFIVTCIGLAAGQYIIELSVLWLLGMLILLLCVLLLLRRYRTFSRYLFFGLLFFFYALFRSSQPLPEHPDIERLAQLRSKISVSAKIDKVVTLSDGRARIDLSHVNLSDKNTVINLSAPLRLRLYVDSYHAALLPGDSVSFSSRLRQPRLFGTPGEFHWPRYLATEGIDMTAWVKDEQALTIEAYGSFSLMRSLAVWKQQVAGIIEAELTPAQSPLVRALLLGEGRLIDDAQRKILAGSGISHLYAISGLHLGMIALFGYFLLLQVYRRSSVLLLWQPPQRVLPLLLIPLLLGYLLFTGDAVATRRAFAVTSLAALFWWYRYLVRPHLLLAACAFISLLFEPLLLWQVSWQLSFAGAGGILWLQPRMQQWTSELRRALRYPLQLFLVSAAATLATAPLVLMNFHLLTPAGVLINLLAVPLVTLVALPLGLLGLTLFSIVPAAAILCFRGCGFFLEGLLSFCGWLQGYTFFTAIPLFLSRWQYLACGLIVLAVFIFLTKKLTSVRLVITCSLLLVAAILSCLPLTQDGPSITMISVGQGESILLRNGQHAMLVDGGGLYSDRFDVGERLLAPALAELGVDRLDAVLLTHDDIDHRKGLHYILNYLPVAAFYSGLKRTELNSELEKILREKSIPMIQVKQGWQPLKVEGFPELSSFRQATPANDNDASVVLYYPVVSGHGLLLTGDLEAQGVTALMKTQLPGPVTILKLPHHGSRYSFTDGLVNMLQPQLSLVSAGYQNSYRQPARQVVEFLNEKGIPLYRTDLQGTVMVMFDYDNIRVFLWKSGFFR